MSKAHEKRRRSIAKSVAYRVMSVSVDSVIAYFFTRDAATTALIVAFVNGYSTLLYYLHERAWAHISWGKREQPATVATKRR